MGVTRLRNVGVTYVPGLATWALRTRLRNVGVTRLRNVGVTRLRNAGAAPALPFEDDTYSFGDYPLGQHMRHSRWRIAWPILMVHHGFDLQTPTENKGIPGWFSINIANKGHETNEFQGGILEHVHFYSRW